LQKCNAKTQKSRIICKNVLRKRKICAIVTLRKCKNEERRDIALFNKLKFKAVVIESGKTLADIAEFLKINESTLYRKINGTSEFSRDEIQNICDFLNLDSPVEIFFAKEIT